MGNSNNQGNKHQVNKMFRGYMYMSVSNKNSCLLLEMQTVNYNRWITIKAEIIIFIKLIM